MKKQLLFVFHSAVPAILVGIVVGVVAGCAATNRNLTDLAGVSVRTIEDTVVLRRTSDATSFDVNVVLRNDSDQPIRVSQGCGGPDAQRNINGTWTSVFAPICVGQPGSWTMQAGDSTVIPVNIYGYTKPNLLPSLDPRMTAGQYRLEFAVSFISSDDTSAPPVFHALATNTFEVKDPVPKE